MLERVAFLLRLSIFIRVIKAHYGVIYVTFSTTPYKIIDILLYSFFFINFYVDI